MKKIYKLRMSEEVECILKQTYQFILASIRYKNQQMSPIIDDDDISALHDLLPLIKLKHIKIYRDDYEKTICLEILEE